MTSIATKNGSLIVKDGSVAESCNCCNECRQVSTIPPSSVTLKISTNSQDQISSMRFTGNAGGPTTLAHTSFMACEDANGTHTLARNSDYVGSSVEVYGFANKAMNAQLQFYSRPPGPYYPHWELQIGGGLLRMVQEYGTGAAIRSKAVMASDEWNANTITSSFSGNWSSPPTQAISNDGYAGYPTIYVGHTCGGTELCKSRTGRGTYYQLGSHNNSQGVMFNGGWCGQILGSSDYSVHDDCVGCENSLAVPIEAAFQRMDLPGVGIFNPGYTIVERNIQYPINYYYSKFQLDWQLEEIAFVYGDHSIVVPL